MRTRYLDIDDRTAELRELEKKLPEQAKELQNWLDCSLIHHENALEGVVYTSQELLCALDPSSVADASMVPVCAEIRNHKMAIDFIRSETLDNRPIVSVTLMKKLYELLNAGPDGTEGKVTYRKDIPVHRTYFHDIIQPAKIPHALEKLVAFTDSSEFYESHPINQAASVQWQFMQAFPFSDDNGRVARMLSNLILVRQGYLPAIIHAVDRQRYYESLRLPVANLRQLLLETMENSLENAFRFYESQAAMRICYASNQ